MNNYGDNHSEHDAFGCTNVYSSYTRKKGFIGLITAPFRRFIESDFFFIVTANFSIKKLVIGTVATAICGTSVYFVLQKSPPTHSSSNNIVTPLIDFSEITTQTPTEPVTEKISKIESKDNIIDVPFYSQDEYPTGCELVSTSMLLAFYGVDINASQLITDGYITTKKVYLNKMKVAYGPDPHMYFIGDPLSDSGYGCYSGTIVAALKKILPNEKYTVVDLTGKSLNTICKRYIDNGIPVLIWGGIGMKKTYINEINCWTIDEGERKGQEFKWHSNEHCLVLVGYDDEYYYFNDPLSNTNITKYSKTATENRFTELGNMAVAVRTK